jgi:hypothetical protein
MGQVSANTVNKNAHAKIAVALLSVSMANTSLFVKTVKGSASANMVAISQHVKPAAVAKSVSIIKSSLCVAFVVVGLCVCMVNKSNGVNLVATLRFVFRAKNLTTLGVEHLETEV